MPQRENPFDDHGKNAHFIRRHMRQTVPRHHPNLLCSQNFKTSSIPFSIIHTLDHEPRPHQRQQQQTTSLIRLQVSFSTQYMLYRKDFRQTKYYLVTSRSRCLLVWA